MNLVRALLHKDIARLHDGPEPGGRFFGAEGLHDLPYIDYTVDLATLLQIGCRVWLQDVGQPGTWQPVTDVESVEQIFSAVSRWTYTSEDSVQVRTIRPYLPEFYVKPFGWRERKMLRTRHAIQARKMTR